jgi:tRNA threonylcarbamoyladenosine biosynthesis protein TsaB
VSWLLCIDTAVQGSSICLTQNDAVVAVKENTDQRESAAWLQVAIKDLLAERFITLHQLSAVAVSAGPGSYTGLRVSMATAKGLCYALGLPLITLNTLHVMADAAKAADTDLLCPMIDARRMEVFTAVYNKQLKEIRAPQPLVLQAISFNDLLAAHTITFFGNGSTKFQALMQHQNARFMPMQNAASQMAFLAYQSWCSKHFADVAYSEPFYGKEFQSPFFKPVI